MNTKPKAWFRADIAWDPLPPGTYHRRVVAIPEGNTVRAGLEDESHHMELTLFHDGARVTDIQAVTRRVPWHACPGAADKLKDLIGTPLQRMHVSTGHDAKQHCTHLFDLARVAIGRAAAKTPVQYDVSIPDRVERRTDATIHRNGTLMLSWQVHGAQVLGPDPFTGHSLRGAPQWPAPLDDDTMEAALVMRRVFLVSQARYPEAAAGRTQGPATDKMLEALKDSNMVGRCYSFQAVRIDTTKSNFTWRNMSGRVDELLKDFPGVRTVGPLSS